ncbi:DUF3429 domain-containing protein [Limnobacter humi]|uniref:DUF3429 domain-containing protein n=1 Tax=Limnobacter humi TaxID=1778671 RepID=A0ABT1WJC1_9BURK|nr:DUF3429 domain-containing protein [Limnobacter humi]MCQ8897610.1 DUF3429 domain-containing protein [Limnobacter humi]
MTDKTPSRWMDILGYAGLIPFWGLAVLTAIHHGTEAGADYAHINLLYALCIVSFLGAVHWGLALTQSNLQHPTYLAGLTPAEFETRSFVWGVTPSLLAWIAAAFSPTEATLWVLTGILALVWLVDQAMLKPLKGFTRYLRLRNHLTIGATLGLALTAWFA